MKNKILNLLSDKRVAAMLLCLARNLSKRTKNTVDDQLVEALERAVIGEDYGLQRKAKLRKAAVKNGKA